MFVIFGASGAGKGAVVARLLELRSELWLSRSWTTRQRRPGEGEGAYVFTDKETFMERARANGFIEWNEYAANHELYGTPTLEPPTGHDVVLEIDLNGARRVKERYPGAVLVLVSAPSRQAREQRLRRRGDDPASIARRLELGEQEDRAGRLIADHVVVNDDLGQAALEVASIVDKYRALAGRAVSSL
ncbi:MAG: guanylate kinase [Acidimicrobiales bacterium]